MAYNKLPSGPDHPLFKGGKRVDMLGYVVLTSKIWGKYCGKREHQMVAEKMLGRPLAEGEHVHHINGVKTDNRPENLQVISSAEHRRIHGSGGMLKCVACGTEKWHSPTDLRRSAKHLYRCQPCGPHFKEKTCKDCFVTFSTVRGVRCQSCRVNHRRNLRRKPRHKL